MVSLILTSMSVIIACLAVGLRYVAEKLDPTPKCELFTTLETTHLLNAKLLFTNKLLQLEGLTAKQKAQVIKQLDEAATPADVERLYHMAVGTQSHKRKNGSKGQCKAIRATNVVTKEALTCLKVTDAARVFATYTSTITGLCRSGRERWGHVFEYATDVTPAQKHYKRSGPDFAGITHVPSPAAPRKPDGDA